MDILLSVSIKAPGMADNATFCLFCLLSSQGKSFMSAPKVEFSYAAKVAIPAALFHSGNAKQTRKAG